MISPFILQAVSLILHIETAVQRGSICLSKGNDVLSVARSESEKDSASWLHPAIEKIFKENGLHLNQLDGISVSAGPGSYTGLRVGLSCAKGLCYALQLPLIFIDSLEIMAAAVQSSNAELLCPMIDARRMEVYTSLYNRNLEKVSGPSNVILDEKFMATELDQHEILFFGNGSIKAKEVIRHKNANFSDCEIGAENMVKLAKRKLESTNFENLAYSEPYYGKEVHTTQPKKLH